MGARRSGWWASGQMARVLASVRGNPPHSEASMWGARKPAVDEWKRGKEHRCTSCEARMRGRVTNSCVSFVRKGWRPTWTYVALDGVACSAGGVREPGQAASDADPAETKCSQTHNGTRGTPAVARGGNVPQAWRRRAHDAGKQTLKLQLLSWEKAGAARDHRSVFGSDPSKAVLPHINSKRNGTIRGEDHGGR